jgi:hypothetical protein
MPKINQASYAFNRGCVSKLALGRVDVERLRLSAEEQTNWLPRTVGPMMLRPGLEYITSTHNNATSKILPFIYSSDDTALLEFTDGFLRVLVDEEPVTRETVTTTVDDFDVPASWSLSTSGGGTADLSTGALLLNYETSGGTATATQTVTLGSSGVVHALRVVVDFGPITFRVGTTSGDDDLIESTPLDEGTHSLAFTPTSTFYIQFESSVALNKIVSSITLEDAGVMLLPTPYMEADLPLIRYDQSADVVFIACVGYQQRRIERRSSTSWSIVKYKADDGPFDSAFDNSITIDTNALNGQAALTSSKPLFKPDHVGSLVRLFHNGQRVLSSLSADETYTDAVRITGVGADRYVTLIISGTWTGTLTLQHNDDNQRQPEQLDCVVSHRVQDGGLWLWHG